MASIDRGTTIIVLLFNQSNNQLHNNCTEIDLILFKTFLIRLKLCHVKLVTHFNLDLNCVMISGSLLRGNQYFGGTYYLHFHGTLKCCVVF